MIAIGWIIFFAVFFMAFWVLLFCFTVMVPASIKLFMLNKFGPTWMKKLAGLED